jgi:hypothetical protein
MTGSRTEGSLLASLNELRAIEHQRLAEEQAAIEAALQARRDERAAAEQAAREAAEARITAERNARLAAEAARAEAERQARLHIEATEAAERARHQAALEERRLGEEMALRREVAMRQRPRWMMALTGCAVICALGLGAVALERQHESTVANEEQGRARKASAEAIAAARESQEELDKLGRQLTGLEIKVADAIERIRLAQTEATRRAAHDNLRQLQRHEAELKEEQHQRDVERKHRERAAGVVISDDCLHNAICK